MTLWDKIETEDNKEMITGIFVIFFPLVILLFSLKIDDETTLWERIKHYWTRGDFLVVAVPASLIISTIWYMALTGV